MITEVRLRRCPIWWYHPNITLWCQVSYCNYCLWILWICNLPVVCLCCRDVWDALPKLVVPFGKHTLTTTSYTCEKSTIWRPTEAAWPTCGKSICPVIPIGFSWSSGKEQLHLPLPIGSPSSGDQLQSSDGSSENWCYNWYTVIIVTYHAMNCWIVDLSREISVRARHSGSINPLDHRLTWRTARPDDEGAPVCCERRRKWGESPSRIGNRRDIGYTCMYVCMYVLYCIVLYCIVWYGMVWYGMV